MNEKKKILLITTTHTGCGHKSISDALMDWFVEMPEVEIKQVDGFEDLVGKSVTAIGDSYGVVTRHAKFLWKLTWDFGTRFNETYCSLMSTWAEKRFIEVVARERPDVVLTTHPMFNSSLLTVCEEHGLDIPFVSVQADPVSVHPSWCDPRSALTESVHACKDAPIINAIVISKDEVRPRAQGCAYLPSAPWTISCSLSTRARVRQHA